MNKTLAAGALTLAALTLLSACGAGTGAAPTGLQAWVATDASVTLPGNGVTPVDLTTRTIESKVHLGSLPSAMAFARGGADLLVVTQGTDMLYEIDPATDAVVHSVEVGVEPDAVAVAPGGKGDQGVALVANLDSNSVTPIDLATWKAGKAIPVGKEPVSIAVAASAPNNGTVFVADFGSNDVTPINLASLVAGTPIPVGTSPQTIAVSIHEDAVLVGNFGSRSLTVITASTLAVVTTIALPVNPTDIAVTSSGSMAYLSGGASLVPLNLSPLAVGPPVTLPDVAQSIALGRGDATAWVALQSGSLVPVTLASGAVGRAIHVGGVPSAVVIDPR